MARQRDTKEGEDNRRELKHPLEKGDSFLILKKGTNVDKKKSDRLAGLSTTRKDH